MPTALRTLVPLLASGLLACATHPETRARTGDFALAVQIPAELSYQEIPSGAAMHSGDRFALQLLVTRPLYLYAQQRASSGAVSSLYPAEGMPAQPVQVNAPPQLPADGYYELDKQPGTEQIVLIAATTPLTPEQLAAEYTRSDSASRSSRDPPPISTSRNRGPIVWGQLNSAGIGAVKFRLVHK